MQIIAQSARAVEYHDCFSAEREDPPKSVLVMTLNNLMVRFQWCWGFEELRCTPSLPLLLGPLWPGMVASYKALSMG